VTAQPPSDPEHRVLPFRPRGSLFSRRPQPTPVQDLSRYERPVSDTPDDYGHRMRMNGLAALVLVALMIAGWWIADSMASLRKTQDCALSGRKNCEKIEVPPKPLP
jgi:hypothetical protein